MAGGRIPPDDLVVAVYSIVIEGVQIGMFSELVELTSGLDPSALTPGPARKGASARKLPGKRTPQTVTLKRNQTSDLTVFAWHRDAMARRAARKDAELVMFDVQGRPLARYHLKSAWPVKVVVGDEQVGAGRMLTETVTIACDDIDRVAP